MLHYHYSECALNSTITCEPVNLSNVIICAQYIHWMLCFRQEILKFTVIEPRARGFCEICAWVRMYGMLKYEV